MISVVKRVLSDAIFVVVDLSFWISVNWNTFKKSWVTIGMILNQEKFKKSGSWHGFGVLYVLWPKRAKPCQLLSFYNFFSSKTSPIVRKGI